MPNKIENILSDDDLRKMQELANHQRRQQEQKAKIRHSEHTVTETIERMQRRAYRPDDHRTRLCIENARQVLWNELTAVVGDAIWLPEYEQVATWLADSKGKGLLCMGDCGRGKTIITQKVLPRIFKNYGRILNCFTAIDLLTHYDEISQYKHICIDDMGTEPNAKKFGVSHNYLAELIDLCERKDKFIVLSTNLNKDEILERYDLRTFDRLKNITERVVFKGASLRDDGNFYRELNDQQRRLEAAKPKK